MKKKKAMKAIAAAGVALGGASYFQDANVVYVQAAENDGSTETVIEASEASETKEAEKTEEKRISLVIKYTKGRLLIRVSNPFSGRLDEKGAGRFRTGKADQKNHGLGLKNMEEAAEKLGGVMRVHTERQVFTLTMLLYVSDQNEKKVGD